MSYLGFMLYYFFGMLLCRVFRPTFLVSTQAAQAGASIYRRSPVKTSVSGSDEKPTAASPTGSKNKMWLRSRKVGIL